MSLDMVDNDPPLAMNVDGTERLNIGCFGWAEVGLFDNVLQPSHRVVSVGQDILVHLLDRVIVVFDGLFDLIGWVFGVFKAPWLGVSLAALWWAIVGFMVRSWVVGSRVVRKRVVWSRVVRSRVVGWSVWFVVVRGRFMVVRGRFMVWGRGVWSGLMVRGIGWGGGW